ncbi:zinc ABC transporter ATP-binding protein ZnuC, partial [Vibrio cholerae O1]|nr:zinc ABC transporter ATP-binding protein ZnuC [Vibrio cholerae O1]
FGHRSRDTLAFYQHHHEHHHHDLSGLPVKGKASVCSHHSHGHHKHD